MKKEILIALKFLFGTLLSFWLIFILRLWWNGTPPTQSLSLLPTATVNALQFAYFWIALVTPYLLFLLFRYWVRSYRLYGFRALLWRVLGFIVLISAFYLGHSQWQNYWRLQEEERLAAQGQKVLNHFSKDGKIRGVHFIAARRPKSTHFHPLLKNNIEWINLNAFAWETKDSIRRAPENTSGWSRKDSSNYHNAVLGQQFGIRSSLTPIVTQEQKLEGNPRIWQQNYQDFLVQQAKVAHALKAELMIIGEGINRELDEHYWNAIIDSIQQYFNGGIACFEMVSNADYLAVNAMDLAMTEEYPTANALTVAMEAHSQRLDSMYNIHQKPILFYKQGFQSKTYPFASKKQLEMLDEAAKSDEEPQHLAYRVFFEVFWEKSWFAGIFLNDWRANHERAGGAYDTGFTPQNKAAEERIKEQFLKKE